MLAEDQPDQSVLLMLVARRRRRADSSRLWALTVERRGEAFFCPLGKGGAVVVVVREKKIADFVISGLNNVKG